MTQTLDQLYSAAVAESQTEYDWYAKSRWGYFAGTWLLRILAIVLLAMGAILPLTNVTFPPNSLFSHPAQAAVAFLVAAGLLVGVNQVLMVSSTWTRYMGAMARIKTLQAIAAWDWKELQDELSDPPTSDHLKRASAVRKALVIGSRQIVEAETAAWSAELAKAVDQLQSIIREQRAATDTLIDKQQKEREVAEKASKQATTGLVRVSFAGAAERLKEGAKVSVGGQVRTLASLRAPIVFESIPAGVCKVVLSEAEAKNGAVITEGAAVVAAGAIAEVSLTIPT